MWQVLYLGYNKFKGSVPEELFTLPNLQMMQIMNNSLSGTVPDVQLNSTQLNMITLNNNLLSGTVPEVFCMPKFSKAIYDFSGNHDLKTCQH